jgi:hypothetical protein
LRGDILRTFVVRRVLVIKGFQLELQLPLAFASSFDLGPLSSQLGLLLLLFFLCASSTLLLFCLLELALLYLLFQCFESCLRSLALFGQLVFLSAFFLPGRVISNILSIHALFHLLHALSLRFLSLLLLSQGLLSNLVLCPLRLSLRLLCIMLCNIGLVLARSWWRRSWLLAGSLDWSWGRRGLAFKSPLPLLLAASVFLFSLPELVLALLLLALCPLLRSLACLGWSS